MEDDIVQIKEINEASTKIVEVINAAFPGRGASSAVVYGLVCVAVSTAMQGVTDPKDFYNRLSELARCMGDYSVHVHEEIFGVSDGPANVTRH